MNTHTVSMRAAVTAALIVSLSACSIAPDARLASNTAGVQNVSPDVTSPEQFARAMYRDQATSRRGVPLWWQHMSGRTKALHRQLQQRTGDGNLAHDWLCSCQDPEGLSIQAVQAVQSSKTTATVSVHTRLPGTKRTSIQVLQLVQEQGWKIDDIIDESGVSYRAALTTWVQRQGR